MRLVALAGVIASLTAASAQAAAYDAWVARGLPAFNKSVSVSGGKFITKVVVAPAAGLTVTIVKKKTSRVSFRVKARNNALQGIIYNLAFKAGPVTRKTYKVYVAHKGSMNNQTLNLQAGQRATLRVTGSNMGKRVSVKFSGRGCGQLQHGPTPAEANRSGTNERKYNTSGNSFTVHLRYAPTNLAANCSLSVFDGKAVNVPTIRSYVQLKYTGNIVVKIKLNQGLGTAMFPVAITAPRKNQTFNTRNIRLTFMQTPGVDKYSVACRRLKFRQGVVIQRAGSVFSATVTNNRNRKRTVPKTLRVPRSGNLTSNRNYECYVSAVRRDSGAEVRRQAKVKFKIN